MSSHKRPEAGELAVRLIEKKDNPAVESLIRTVMPEFGASGAGFAIQDAEVSSMYEAHSGEGCAYFVLKRQENIVGGSGIGPLAGADEDICELRKMYLLPQARGLGQGQRLLDSCLEAARQRGFTICYLETLKSMTLANKLYVRNDFKPISKPVGNTGHFGCNSWHIRAL